MNKLIKNEANPATTFKSLIIIDETLPTISKAIITEKLKCDKIVPKDAVLKIKSPKKIFKNESPSTIKNKNKLKLQKQEVMRELQESTPFPKPRHNNSLRSNSCPVTSKSRSMSKKPVRSNSTPNDAYAPKQAAFSIPMLPNDAYAPKQAAFSIPMLPNDVYVQNHEESQDTFWIPTLPNDAYAQIHEEPLPNHAYTQIHEEPLPNDAYTQIHEEPLPNDAYTQIHEEPLPNDAYAQIHEEPIINQDALWIPMLPNDVYAQNHEKSIVKQDEFCIPMLPNDVYAQNHEESIVKQDELCIPMLLGGSFNNATEENFNQQIDTDYPSNSKINSSLYASTSECMSFCRDDNTDDWMY
ncbi:6506_t:CDS:2 [Racocetra persica]|uniref:6506_t:CDS:1 n=1 Tax=Racocetra persica TaxID=160502 RepID=A0ACA9MXE8_9GLOM|nr:6506_t:CDS:2 [Racocetra persica]